MDDLKIEGHKLIYHVSRVKGWLEGQDICPVYVEISPSAACNYRCFFCAFDYLKPDNTYIESNVLMKRIREMGRLGVKSVMYAGEGEPLMHKDIVKLIQHTRKAGIDVALTTNGLLFEGALAQESLGALTWLRVSLDAATPKTYAKIHNAGPRDFRRVINNIINAVKLRKMNNYSCAIGAQLLLLEQNYNEILPLAKLLEGAGLDYLIIKPYSQHPMSKNRINWDFRSRVPKIKEKIAKFRGKNLKIIFREHAMRKINEAKPYKHCLALPFWAVIDSCGDVYACSAFLGNKSFCYGNIYEDSFRKICEGRKRRGIVKKASRILDAAKCRQACRMDEINRYLWELKNPPEHANFI